MQRLLVGAVSALGLLAPTAAMAADAQVMAPIRQFIDGFNKGDVKAAEAAHAADAVIVDEAPPFVWKSPGAFQAWLADLTKDEKARGRTDGAVVLSEPTREEVAGDAAYVVVPAEYTFKEKGVPMHEPSQMTYSLKKTASGWKITSWTWTGPAPTPRN